MPGVIDGIDEVGGVLDGLAVSWVDDLSDDALLGSLAAVERHRRVLDATVMHLVAEADARSVSDRTAGLATSTWIAREGRQSFGAARRKVIVARALAERFDEVDAAMVKGEIGFEHAWVIVNATHPRIADAMEAIQDRLLRLAVRADVHGVATRGRTHRRTPRRPAIGRARRRRRLQSTVVRPRPRRLGLAPGAVRGIVGRDHRARAADDRRPVAPRLPGRPRRVPGTGRSRS